MKLPASHHSCFAAACAILIFALNGTAQAVLPSWANGPTKKAITDFVARVTTPGGPDFVPEAERIATFDNDGTLWSEQPLYFQFMFALDRVKAMSPSHPEWKSQQPFEAVLENDHKALLAGGEKALLQIVIATHSGMTTDQFTKTVSDWLATARHPRFKRPYTDLVFQPMLELLTYLRNNQFKTFIVSGGDLEFMRTWTERVYGIPPEQVVGTSLKTKFDLLNGKPVISRLPQLDFLDDGPGKPVGIEKFIGRRPVFAFGNSDGDLQMLEYTTGSRGARFGAIVHHTDKTREWAYDRQSSIGRLNKALDLATSNHWLVVDMAKDWNRIYAFDRSK